MRAVPTTPHNSSRPATNEAVPPNAPSAQARKLGLKAGVQLSLDEAPAGWMLDNLLDDVVLVEPPAPADVIVAFVTQASELAGRIPFLAERIFPAGALWIAWPRKAAGHASDLGDVVIRDALLNYGLVDTKVAAIDIDWSGLKFVWRLEMRKRVSQPTEVSD